MERRPKLIALRRSQLMVWFEYQWRVEKEEMRKKEFNKYMTSKEFATIRNGLRYHWQLLLYPKGKKTEKTPTADKETDMAIALCIRDGGIKIVVEAEFKLSIIGGKEGSSRGPTVFNFRWNTEPSNGKAKGAGFYIHPHQKLDAIGTETEVEFRVRIGIRERYFDFRHLFPHPSLTFCPKRLILYQDTIVKGRDEGDAVLIAGSERISCHRDILTLSSPVFQTMFNSENQESQSGEVIIQDVFAQTLKQLLYFFYVEDLPQDWKDDVLGLLYAAHKYDVKSLELLCEKEAVVQLSLETVVESLMLGNLLGKRLLEMKAIHYVLDHWDELPEDKKEELNGNNAIVAALDIPRNIKKAILAKTDPVL